MASTPVGAPERAPATTGPAPAGQRRAENFPVAPRVLPRRLRTDLVAVYNVARIIDDLGDRTAGDRTAGDRTALLAGFDVDLAVTWAGERPEHPEEPTARAGEQRDALLVLA
ncbi:MAG: squalene/phytoene synthase family protein [Pseudonocardiaceae bacterium]